MASAARKQSSAATSTSAPTPALRVIEQEQRVGDLDLTRETMAGWKQGQRICRARKRHNWSPYTVWEHRNYYEVVEQCTHCRNRRSAEFVKTAYGLRKNGQWQPVYRDGYLLPKGAQRIDEDLHDELTAQDILSRRIVEVSDDEGSK